MEAAAAACRQIVEKAAERPQETPQRMFTDGLKILPRAFKLAEYHQDEIRRIFVLNFKGGEMSAALLKHFPLAQVVSHTNRKDFHIEAGKKHIDATFPWRHVLRLGPWTDIIDQLNEFDPKKFDMLVVDTQPSELEAVRGVLSMLPHLRPQAPVLFLDAKQNHGNDDRFKVNSSAWKKLVHFQALDARGAKASEAFVMLKTR